VGALSQLHARDFVDYDSRKARMQYLARTFARVLKGRALDVGCDMRHLKTLAPQLDYVGIDVAGEPDLKLDLERLERLPFPDRDFDLVVCSEVLEHLDNLHQVFSELVRVSRERVLISLPNCWAEARRPIGRGKGGMMHYGLPARRPQDRHKWFFSLSEGRAFVDAMAAEHGLEIEELRIAEKPRPLLVRGLRRMRHVRQEYYLNRYAHTLWVLYRRGRVSSSSA